MRQRSRLSNEQIKARLVLIVGVGLTVVFVGSILALLMGLLFVTQPSTMPESDRESWATLNPLLMSLSGGLLGLLAANGLRDKHDDKDKDKT